MNFVIYCQGYRAAKEEEGEEILKIKNPVPSECEDEATRRHFLNENYLKHGKKVKRQCTETETLIKKPIKIHGRNYNTKSS